MKNTTILSVFICSKLAIACEVFVFGWLFFGLVMIGHIHVAFAGSYNIPDTNGETMTVSLSQEEDNYFYNSLEVHCIYNITTGGHFADSDSGGVNPGEAPEGSIDINQALIDAEWSFDDTYAIVSVNGLPPHGSFNECEGESGEGIDYPEILASASGGVLIFSFSEGTILSCGSVEDLTASAGILFTDLWPIIALLAGIPLAFYILSQTVAFFKRKDAEIDKMYPAHAKEYKEDEKARKRWEKRYGKE